MIDIIVTNKLLTYSASSLFPLAQGKHESAELVLEVSDELIIN